MFQLPTCTQTLVYTHFLSFLSFKKRFFFRRVTLLRQKPKKINSKSRSRVETHRSMVLLKTVRAITRPQLLQDRSPNDSKNFLVTFFVGISTIKRKVTQLEVAPYPRPATIIRTTGDLMNQEPDRKRWCRQFPPKSSPSARPNLRKHNSSQII